jgi:hypothetical protein
MFLFLWPSFNGPNLSLLGILAALIAASVYAVLLPGYFRQLQTPRPHNNERLLNEVLSNHQLIYLPFYLTLKRFVPIDPGDDWIGDMLTTLIILTLIFAAYGLFKLFTQDRILSRIHDSCTGPECETALSRATKWRLYGLNLLLSILSLAIAISLAVSPVIKGPRMAPKGSAPTADSVPTLESTPK